MIVFKMQLPRYRSSECLMFCILVPGGQKPQKHNNTFFHLTERERQSKKGGVGVLGFLNSHCQTSSLSPPSQTRNSGVGAVAHGERSKFCDLLSAWSASRHLMGRVPPFQLPPRCRKSEDFLDRLRRAMR